MCDIFVPRWFWLAWWCMAFWRLVPISRVLNGWRPSCFVGQRHLVVLCSTWMVNNESRKRDINDWFHHHVFGQWLLLCKQIELVIPRLHSQLCVRYIPYSRISQPKWFTRFAMDGVALFTASCVALSSCAWERKSGKSLLSNWRLFWPYSWWAKSRKPRVIYCKYQ